MNKLLLENGVNYLVISECVYDNKKYFYLINEKDDKDFKFMELIENSILKEIVESNLLKEIIKIMLDSVYKFDD